VVSCLLGILKLLAKNKDIVNVCHIPENPSLVFINVATHIENVENPTTVIVMIIMASTMYSEFGAILTPINRAIDVIRNCMSTLVTDAEDTLSIIDQVL